MYRNIVKKLNSWLDRDEIIVILGARQVGKTSLLHYLQEKLDAEGEKTYFLDLEDIELRSYIKSVRNLISFLEALGWRKGQRAYIFLDEIHYIEDISSILKYTHDHYPELKLIATGSSSLKLKFKMGEPLTGRKVVFDLHPLSFSEFLYFSGKQEFKEILDNSQGRKIPEPLISHILAAYEEYVIYGGYPKVALATSYDMKEQILKEVQTTYIDKEIRGLMREESFSKFRFLMEFLAAQNGGLVKVLEISKEVGIARATVQRYITILEETFIIGLLRPWAKNRQKELTRVPKLYFLDTGFLNFTIKDFRSFFLRTDTGKLIESTVYTALLRELRSTEEIRFLREKTGNEIDFILRREKKIIPIEVKWREVDKIPDVIQRLVKNMRLDIAYVVSKDIWDEKKINNCPIKFLPPWSIEFDLWQKSSLSSASHNPL
ncbi:MAG: ATP-binding protein [Acidobacteriota bacterium]